MLPKIKKIINNKFLNHNRKTNSKWNIDFDKKKTLFILIYSILNILIFIIRLFIIYNL